MSALQTDGTRAFGLAWTKVLALAGAYDLAAITVPAVVVWVFWFEAANIGVFALVTVLRFVGLFALLRWLYRGLHQSKSLAAYDTSELLALEQQLRLAPRRFARVFALSVIVALAATTGVNELGWVDATPLPRGELRMLALLLLGLGLGVSPMVTTLLEPPLLELRAEIGAQLSDRGADEQRETNSLVGWSARLNVAYLLCIFFCMTGVFGKFAVGGWQAAAIDLQRVRVNQAARALDQGASLDEVLAEPGLTLVDDPAALPTELVARSDSDEDTDEDLAGIDVRANAAVATLALGDGRWLVSQAPLDDRSALIWLFAVLFPAVFVGPLTFANLAATRAQTDQMRELRAVTRQVLAGRGLEGIVRFRPPTNDELGQLVREFNEMLDVLTELVKAAHAVADGDLTVQLERPGDFHDAFRGMLTSLQQVVGQVHETALELGDAANDIRAGIGEQEQAVAEQSQIVAEVRAAVEELVVASGAIGSSAQAVRANAELTEGDANSMVDQITSLGESVDKIGLLLESVKGIAGRSDLLALNGSLEATRAGEAGRGFTIVAAEMRRLAEQIAGTVVEVGE